MNKLYGHPDRAMKCEDWVEEFEKRLKYMMDCTEEDKR